MPGYRFWDMILYIARRAPYLISRKALQIMFGLAVFSVIARSLPKEQFAIYNLVFGFIAILRLTALPGLGMAISQGFARGLPGNFSRVVKLSLLGSVLGAILLVCAGWWHYLSNKAEAGHALIAAAAFFPLVGGLTMWRNAAVGSERYGNLFLYDSLSSAAKCTGVILAIWAFGSRLPLVVIGALLGPGIINILATYKELGRVEKGAGSEQGSIAYGIRTTLYQLPTTLVQQLDKIVLFYFISSNALAIYAVALRIPELLRTVFGETNTTLGPRFAREEKYTTELNHFSLKLWALYFAITVLGAVILVPILLPILVGAGYLEAISYAQIMTIGVGLGCLGDIQFRYVKWHLHARNFLMVTFSKAALDCALILGLATCLGMFGVVLAYVLRHISYTLVTSIVIRSAYVRPQRHPVTALKKNLDGQGNL